MKKIAIIPARGGSKGIPRKNLKYILGMPMIAYSIKAAQQSQQISSVYVSTDDREIAEVAERFGAQIIMRPAELSDDKASSESALIHAIEHIKKHEKFVPDILVFLQCTSPLTTAEDIDGTIKELLINDADTSFAAIPYHYYLWKYLENGTITGINHDKSVRLPRQQHEDQFLETGAIYVMKTNGFLKHKHRFFGKTVIHVMPNERVLEIDELSDLDVAKARLQQSNIGHLISLLPEKIEAVFFDFDGVFTDNKVYINENGKEGVKCDRSDGLGISLLKKRNIKCMVLSTEKNSVVKERCKKLGIECVNGIDNKLAYLKDYCTSNNYDMEHIVYLGNDLNDLECIKAAGFGVAVNDSFQEIKNKSDLILEHNGGDGAIRELVDLILNKKGL